MFEPSVCSGGRMSAEPYKDDVSSLIKCPQHQFKRTVTFNIKKKSNLTKIGVTKYIRSDRAVEVYHMRECTVFIQNVSWVQKVINCIEERGFGENGDLNVSQLTKYFLSGFFLRRIE